MGTLNEAISILDDLIAFPTISSDSNKNIIKYIAKVLRSYGAEVHIQESECRTKANLFATIGPDIDGGLVLSGHSDVVPVAEQVWHHEPFKMQQIDGLLYGRGTCDMKGFIACTIAMLPKLSSMELKRPVHFAITYDEETGCLGAQVLADWLRQSQVKPNICIIGEPTEMKVIEGHKGMCEYQVKLTGLAGHGSTPDKGVNAVEYAVRYVSHLLSLGEELKTRAPVDSLFEPAWTTINVGSLTGGIAANVIAEHAQIEWEFRPVQDDDFNYVKISVNAFVQDKLLPKMQAAHPYADIETHVIGEVEGFETTTDNEARSICCALTGNERAETVPFGTEAGIFQKLGISTVVCGPGSIAQAHKADEFVSIAEMEKCVAFLDQLLDRYNG